MEWLWSAGELVLTGQTELLGRDNDDNVSCRMSGHLFTSFDLGRSLLFPKVFVSSSTLRSCLRAAVAQSLLVTRLLVVLGANVV
jgi:hypothetical protein